MKKILLIITIISSINASDHATELGDAFAGGMIQGFTDMGEMIYNTISNPTSSIEKLNCSREYGKFYNQSVKEYWKYRYENDDIKKILRDRHINYYTILKYKTKRYQPNYKKIKEQSCSKSYFNMRVRQEKSVFRAKEENRILRELAKANYIDLENELKDTYDKVEIDLSNTPGEKDREKAKLDLKKQLQMSIQ